MRDSDNIRTASTLSSAFYTDPLMFERMREEILARSWQFIGDSDIVRLPGQVHPLTLLEGSLDEPILVARDANDQLHCMSNVCTHRGNLVAETPAAKVTRLTCSYHGRRFKLDGTFEYMPEFDQAECFPSECDNLPKLNFETWGKFMFASIDPMCALDDVIGAMKKRLDWFDLDACRLDTQRSRDYLVRANWALYCDNYLEGFHIPFVHAGLNDALDYGAYVTELYPWSNLQLGVSSGGESCFDLPPSSPDHGTDVAAYYYWLFPNTMFNVYPWGISVNVVQPLAVDRTKVSFYTYVADESKLDQGAGADLDRVEREDEAVVESVQRGMRSRLYERGRYSPTREQGVHHFHQLIRTVMK